MKEIFISEKTRFLLRKHIRLICCMLMLVAALFAFWKPVYADAAKQDTSYPIRFYGFDGALVEEESRATINQVQWDSVTDQAFIELQLPEVNIAVADSYGQFVWKDNEGNTYNEGQIITLTHYYLDSERESYPLDLFLTWESLNPWERVDGKWYYHLDNQTLLKNTWFKSGVNNCWYHFDANGTMNDGWQKISGKWYYFGGANDGSMKSGWQKISGKWYYFGGANDGSMKSGWQKIRGKWYYFGGTNDGAMKSGWQKISGKWYYFGNDNDGAMKSGWQRISNKWYYFNDSGSMIKSAWRGNYYLSSDGTMAVNQWVGKYYVGSDGKWIPGKKRE